MSPPDRSELLSGRNLSRTVRRIAGRRLQPEIEGKYLHWDELRHRPAPDGLDHKLWWITVKWAREALYKAFPLHDTTDGCFVYATPDCVLELLHFADQNASGSIEIAEEVTNKATRDRYIISSLIEEAIASSQLEGAATTRERAREMLRSGQRPRDRDEQMILNNFEALQLVKTFVGKDLTPECIFELHRVVTHATLRDPERAGRFREEGDDIVVEDHQGQVLHVPPDAKELPDRMRAMCRFANQGAGGGPFMHPVVRATLLHFWLAYDHPFVDGNGRTARALFYWSMLSSGYWLTEFISISAILRKARAKYARAFLHSETDGNDATYFLIYQLHVFKRAVRDLHDFLRRKVEEVREVEALLRAEGTFNHRQLALLGHVIRHPLGVYTFESHRASHDVTYQTARTDLLGLVERGFLEQARMGRRFVFRPVTDLSDRLTAAVS